MMQGKATDKQVAYLLALMAQHGYGTEWMGSEHKRLGASMRERTGRVDAWLRSISISRASGLIDKLKEA